MKFGLLSSLVHTASVHIDPFPANVAETIEKLGSWFLPAK